MIMLQQVAWSYRFEPSYFLSEMPFFCRLAAVNVAEKNRCYFVRFSGEGEDDSKTRGERGNATHARRKGREVKKITKYEGQNSTNNGARAGAIFFAPLPSRVTRIPRLPRVLHSSSRAPEKRKKKKIMTPVLICRLYRLREMRC